MSRGPTATPVPLQTIRAQLRDLGYLGGGMTGWIAPAGRARSGGGWWRVALASAARAACLAAPVLAIPATIAIVLANRPHRLPIADVAILATYLTVLFFLAILLLEVAGDLVLVAMARSGLVFIGRAERLAGRVGLFFTLATTLYLILLLREGRMAATAAGTGGAGWLIWGALLLAALGAGHVIGTLTRVGSLVGLLAAGGSARAVRRGGRLPAWVLGLTLIGVGVAFVLIPAPDASPGEILRPGSMVPRPTPGRVVVIGVDGLDADLAAGWGESGDSNRPALARLATRSARFPLRGRPGDPPPVVWTGVMTGHPAAEHGVLGYSATRLPGLSVPLQEVERGMSFSWRLLWPPLRPHRRAVGASFRRLPALWDLLPAAGIPGAAVNWWASWPVRTAPGVRIVSDRALFRFLAGEPPDRDVWPDDLQRDLAAAFPQDREQVERTLGQTGLDATGGAGERARQAGFIDAWHGLITLRFLDDRRIRVVVTYLPGLDIARTGGVAGGDGPILSLLDRLLEGVLLRLGEEDLLVVLGDPGRNPRSRGATDPRGVMIVHGGRVARLGEGEPLDRADVLPSLAALAGIPVAADLPGRPRPGFLAPGDPAAVDPVRIPTYGVLPSTHQEKPDPMDDELLDRLRSLGYIR